MVTVVDNGRRVMRMKTDQGKGKRWWLRFRGKGDWGEEGFGEKKKN